MLPLGLSVFTTHAAGVPRAMQGHVAVTSTLFLAPLVRHLAWWMGFRSASREVRARTPRRSQARACASLRACVHVACKPMSTAPTCRRRRRPSSLFFQSLQACLEAGESVSLCPGGVAECFHMSREPDREFAYLRSRTGFVR